VEFDGELPVKCTEQSLERKS